MSMINDVIKKYCKFSPLHNAFCLEALSCNILRKIAISYESGCLKMKSYCILTSTGNKQIRLTSYKEGFSLLQSSGPG